MTRFYDFSWIFGDGSREDYLGLSSSEVDAITSKMRADFSEAREWDGKHWVSTFTPRSRRHAITAVVTEHDTESNTGVIIGEVFV